MKPKSAAFAVAIMALCLGLGLLTFSLLAPPLYAHHGTATYDMGNRVTVKGTVVLFDWSNPHSQLHFDATDDKGNVVHWNLECQPPSILNHAGWTKDTLKPGDKITITFSPAKNGTPVGIFNKVVLPNGQELTQQTR